MIVAPLLDEAGDIEIADDDIRIDTYRSSGAGGQHVNKTDSAVRITHMPSGIVVAVQNERSQSANKDTALKILRSRLAEKAEEEREAELARERGGVSMGFGGDTPQLRPSPVPAGKGRPHRLRSRQHAGSPRRRSRRFHPRVSTANCRTDVVVRRKLR